MAKTAKLALLIAEYYAAYNAVVMCIIVGIWNKNSLRKGQKFIFDEIVTLNEEGKKQVEIKRHKAQNINAYLLDTENILIEKASKPLFNHS